jgi:hypothetical protein
MKTSFTPTLLRLLGAAFLATASAACSGTAGTAPATPTPAPASTPAPISTPAPVTAAAPAQAGLMQQIDAEIGAAACDSAQQCKTIAIGHKACGGPESYKAYSTKTGDGAKLARLAADYATERKNQDAKSGRMSTCSVVMDPGATCNAGRCVTAAPSLGGSAAQ